MNHRVVRRGWASDRAAGNRAVSSTIRNIVDATKAIEQMAATHAEGHDCLDLAKNANGAGQAQAIILLELKQRGHEKAMDQPRSHLGPAVSPRRSPTPRKRSRPGWDALRRPG